MMHDAFTVTVDDAMRLIIIRLRGTEPGRYYAEKYRETYAAIAQPWTYDRLLDHRHFKGLMSYEDVAMLAEQWADLTRDIDSTSRIAILTRDPLAAARINAMRPLYPNVDIQVFSAQHDALDWLGVALAA